MDEKCPICGGEGRRVWIQSYLRSAVFSLQCSACGYLEKTTIMRRAKDGHFGGSRKNSNDSASRERKSVQIAVLFFRGLTWIPVYECLDGSLIKAGGASQEFGAAPIA
jgi:hypothetical protein